MRTRFSVDGAFTAPERLALQEAVDDLRAFSGGHIDFSLSYDFDNDDGNPHIYRLESWMRIVRERDAEATADRGEVFIHGGWTSGDIVHLVADRVPLENLKSLATHELGHAAGFSWPHCQDVRSSCHHSPDPKALMFPSGPFAGNSLGPADLDFCRASCLCP